MLNCCDKKYYNIMTTKINTYPRFLYIKSAAIPVLIVPLSADKCHDIILQINFDNNVLYVTFSHLQPHYTAVMYY